MSRLKEAILAKGKAYSGHTNMLDLSHGGQNGHNSAIGRVGADGKNYDEWISNQAHVKQNIIPVVLSYPKGLDFMPNPQGWIDAYNAIMTLHPLTIDGLTSGLTAEFDEHAIAGGEMQEELTKVTRARSALSMTFKEKSGKSIQKYIDMVMRYLYSDPDSEKPLVTDLTTDDFGGMYTPDYFTGTHLYIEPDVTQRRVVDAWLCTNIMFKGNGDRTGKRDIHSARETIDLSIDLTSITMNNEAVLNLADTILGNLSVINTNPQLAMVVPTNEVAPNLLSGTTNFNSTSYNSVPQPAA